MTEERPDDWCKVTIRQVRRWEHAITLHYVIPGSALLPPVENARTWFLLGSRRRALRVARRVVRRHRRRCEREARWRAEEKEVD